MPRKKVNIPFFFFGLVCISIAFVLIWNIGKGIITTRNTGIIQTSLQRIEIKIPASGFVSKTEHLIFSPLDGKVERLEEAGELLRSGTEVVRIHKGSNEHEVITNEHHGILTFIKDDCEEHYIIQNLNQMLLKEILEPPVKMSRVGDDQNVKTGDFIFKIVENDIMHFALVIPPQFKNIVENLKQHRFYENSNLTFRVENPTNLLLAGKIEKIEEREKNHLLVVFTTPFYVDVLLNTRFISGFFTFGYVTASLVPQSSIMIDDEGKSYAIEHKEDPTKIPVTLLGIDPFSNQYIVDGLGSSQEIYINAAQWADQLEKP